MKCYDPLYCAVIDGEMMCIPHFRPRRDPHEIFQYRGADITMADILVVGCGSCAACVGEEISDEYY